MSKVEKISIAVTNELAEAMRIAVSSGDYASTSEVVREALRDWTDKRERRAAGLADLRRAIQEGLDSGPAERRRPLGEFLAESRRRLAERRGG